MKFCTLFVTLSALTISTFAMSGSSVKSSAVFGDYEYFAAPSSVTVNRAKALEYCLSQDAQLAKVTNKPLFDKLRFELRSAAYWIDGIDKESLDRFALNSTCTSGTFDPSGLTSDELRLPAKSCLALVIGSGDKTSRIEAMDCTVSNQVLCANPLSGCDK